MNFRTKSIMNMIQITMPIVSKIGFGSNTSSTTNKINQMNPRTIRGPSKRSSSLVRSFLLSLLVSEVMEWCSLLLNNQRSEFDLYFGPQRHEDTKRHEESKNSFATHVQYHVLE
jgi:hypothetical protein